MNVAPVAGVAGAAEQNDEKQPDASPVWIDEFFYSSCGFIPNKI